MNESESIVLVRDVNAILIPDGTPSTLAKGEIVTLHQSQGENFTVATERGYLVRIAGVDADAIGKEPPGIDDLVSETDPQSVEKNAWEVMRTIFDPEIAVNIVELGLVYDCQVKPIAKGENDVQIKMTLTAPGCGMGPVLQTDVETGLRKLPGVNSVDVELVFDPPWSMDMMSEVAKVELGMI